MLIGLLLSVLGIILLRTGNDILGAATVLAGPVLFLVAAARVDDMTFTPEMLTLFIQTWMPGGLIVLSIILCAVSVNDVAHRTYLEDTGVAISAWAASLVCLIVGVLWYDHWRPALRASLAWFRTHLIECLILAAVMAVSVVARMVILDQHPYPWSGDEASVGSEAQRLLGLQHLDVFNSGWSGNPLSAFYLTTVLEILFGVSVHTVRLASAITGIFAVFFLYLLARELFDTRVALIAAAFLSTFPYHLHFSRFGVMTIQDTLVASLTLWLVVRALRLGSPSAFLWAGIATGLTFFTYVGGRIVLVLGFAAIIFVLGHQRDYLKAHLRGLGVYLLATSITLAPMAAFFALHFQDFFARYYEVAIIPSGWLASELTKPGVTLGGVLLDQFVTTTLTFISWSASGSFFNYPQPYLTIAGSLFFILGMGLAIQRWRQPASLLMLTWFWLVVIAGGVLTITPPANTRMVMTIPTVAIFVAIGISKLLDILGHFRIALPFRMVLGALVVLGLAIYNSYYYFGPYREGAYFHDINSETAMQAGLRLTDLGPDYTLVMLGAPRLFSDFPTIPFVAPGSNRVDLESAMTHDATLDGLLPAFVVATPDNLTALQAIARRFPGGAWETVRSESQPVVLYFGYVIPASIQQPSP